MSYIKEKKKEGGVLDTFVVPKRKTFEISFEKIPQMHSDDGCAAYLYIITYLQLSTSALNGARKISQSPQLITVLIPVRCTLCRLSSM